MKHFRGILLAFILLMLLNSSVLAYTYSTTITVQETNGTAYTPMTLIADIDNDMLATNNFIEADGLDTRVLYSDSEVAHMVVDDSTIFFAYSIFGDSTNNFDYTWGNSDLTSMAIVPGYEGYFTILDAAALEPTNNFDLEVSGYFTTTETDNIIYKQDAFELFVRESGTVTALIADSASQTLGLPAVNRANVVPATLTYIAVDNPATADGIIERVQIMANVGNDLANTVVGTFFLVAGTTYECRDSVAIGAVTGLQTFEDLALEVNTGDYIGIYFTAGNLENDVAGEGGLYEVAGEHIDPGDQAVYALQAAEGMSLNAVVPVWVHASVATGEHVIAATADTVDLKIYVDTVEEDSMALGGESVPGNANDWEIMSISTPYLDYYKHTVAGTLIAWYQPIDIISGTTLPDREGAAQDGDFTYGANPAGISVTLGSAVPSSQLTPVVTEETDPQDIIHTGGNTDPDTYNVPDAGTIARAAYDFFNLLITALNTVSPMNLPSAMTILNLISCLISFLLMLFLGIKIPEHRWFVFLVGLASFGLFVGLQFLPLWTVIVFAPLGGVFLMLERKPVL